MDMWWYDYEYHITSFSRAANAALGSFLTMINAQELALYTPRTNVRVGQAPSYYEAVQIIQYTQNPMLGNWRRLLTVRETIEQLAGQNGYSYETLVTCSSVRFYNDWQCNLYDIDKLLLNPPKRNTPLWCDGNHGLKFQNDDMWLFFLEDLFAKYAEGKTLQSSVKWVGPHKIHAVFASATCLRLDPELDQKVRFLYYD